MTVAGVYRNGKVERVDLPAELNDNIPVTGTFVTKRRIDLQAQGIGKAEAAELRARLMSFVEEWERPEMEWYDDYDRVKGSL